VTGSLFTQARTLKKKHRPLAHHHHHHPKTPSSWTNNLQKGGCTFQNLQSSLKKVALAQLPVAPKVRVRVHLEGASAGLVVCTTCREATVVIMSSVDETRRKAQKPAATLSDALNMLEVRE
jgi:predicted metal-binding protein